MTLEIKVIILNIIFINRTELQVHQSYIFLKTLHASLKDNLEISPPSLLDLPNSISKFLLFILKTLTEFLQGFQCYL